MDLTRSGGYFVSLIYVQHFRGLYRTRVRWMGGEIILGGGFVLNLFFSFHLTYLPTYLG